MPDQGLCEKGLEETGRVLFRKTGWRVFLLGKEGAVRSGVDRLRGGDTPAGGMEDQELWPPDQLGGLWPSLQATFLLGGSLK